MPNNKNSTTTTTSVAPGLIGRLVDVADAAAMLRVNPCTLRDWIAAGKIRAYKVAGSAVRLDPQDFNDLVQPYTPRPRPASAAATP